MSTANTNSVPPADLARSPAAKSPPPNGSSNAATQLSEAIDEFLADVENKFKVMNEEILTKLDDMAERCDRLEAELLLGEAEGGKMNTGSNENQS